VPAVEVLRNTKLVAEMIERGDFGGVREAMESSMAPGSQTFEQELLRLVSQGVVTQDEALSHADSQANLMWQLQNLIMAGGAAGAGATSRPGSVVEPPAFTAFTVDVREPAMRLPPVERTPRAAG